MGLIADILLAAGAMAAAFYCYVLSRRLRRFADLDKGVGGAIAVLSVQVDDLTRTLKSAEAAAGRSADMLAHESARAEAAAKRLELLIASLHDLPEPTPNPRPISPFFTRAPSPEGETA